jgi:hypothetical protein
VGCRFQLIENKAEKNSLQTESENRPGWRPLRREMRAVTYAQDYPQALCAIFSTVINQGLAGSCCGVC